MKRVTGLIFGMMLSMAANAGEQVAVSGAWARATAPGQDSAAVSLDITSQQDGQLVGVSTPVAKRGEIHTMKHENGMMMMRAVDSLALPAGQLVSLGSGDHIMLVGLKHPLKPGEHIPLKLVVKLKGKHKITVKVNAEVRMSAPAHDMGDMKGMESMHH